MFGFGKKKNNTKGPVEYGNEFRVAFENQDMQKMMIITEKWLKDCPRDANANYAYGVVLGLLAIMGNLEKSEALKRMDLIAKGAPTLANDGDMVGLDIEKIMLDGFYEGLFESCYRDVKNL